MLNWLKKRADRTAAAERLYAAIVSEARRPVFYAELDVADDISGRFEMMVVHVFLVVERLKLEGDEGEKLGQRVLEVFFRTMDHELREMGVGDLTVPKKMTKMAEAVFGRLQSYSAGLRDETPERLSAALARNVYETEPDAAALDRLTFYIPRAMRRLTELPTSHLMQGHLQFPDVPGLGEVSGAGRLPEAGGATAHG